MMNSPITADDDSRLLKESDAADLLDVSVRTLQAWRLRGAGPPYVNVGRKVRYRLRDINWWLGVNTVTHGAVASET
jgi:predicted site-specific integrase-resolvase